MYQPKLFCVKAVLYVGIMLWYLGGWHSQNLTVIAFGLVGLYLVHAGVFERLAIASLGKRETSSFRVWLVGLLYLICFVVGLSFLYDGLLSLFRSALDG